MFRKKVHMESEKEWGIICARATIEVTVDGKKLSDEEYSEVEHIYKEYFENSLIDSLDEVNIEVDKRCFKTRFNHGSCILTILQHILADPTQFVNNVVMAINIASMIKKQLKKMIEDSYRGRNNDSDVNVDVDTIVKILSVNDILNSESNQQVVKVNGGIMINHPGSGTIINLTFERN